MSLKAPSWRGAPDVRRKGSPPSRQPRRVSSSRLMDIPGRPASPQELACIAPEDLASDLTALKQQYHRLEIEYVKAKTETRRLGALLTRATIKLQDNEAKANHEMVQALLREIQRESSPAEQLIRLEVMEAEVVACMGRLQLQLDTIQSLQARISPPEPLQPQPLSRTRPRSYINPAHKTYAYNAPDKRPGTAAVPKLKVFGATLFDRARSSSPTRSDGKGGANGRPQSASPSRLTGSARSSSRPVIMAGAEVMAVKSEPILAKLMFTPDGNEDNRDVVEASAELWLDNQLQQSGLDEQSNFLISAGTMSDEAEKQASRQLVANAVAQLQKSASSNDRNTAKMENQSPAEVVADADQLMDALSAGLPEVVISADLGRRLTASMSSRKGSSDPPTVDNADEPEVELIARAGEPTEADAAPAAARWSRSNSRKTTSFKRGGTRSAGVSLAGEADDDDAALPSLQTIVSGLPSEQQETESSAPYDALPTPAVFALRPSFKRPTVDDSTAPVPLTEAQSEEAPVAPATPDDSGPEVDTELAADQPALAADGPAEPANEPTPSIAPALAASRRLLSKNSRVSFREPAKESVLEVPPPVPEEEEAAVDPGSTEAVE